VAFVPYVPPPSPSPRAQELGQRVALTIAEFQQKYPDLSDEEIRQALAAVGPSASGEGRPAAALGAIAAAVAVVAGLGVYLFARGGGAAPTRPIVFGLAVVAAVVALVAARRRRE